MEESSWWDGAFDVFSSVGEDVTKSAAGSAGDWLKGSIGSFLKVGPEPTGNLSAEQIAAGARGQSSGVFINSSSMPANALSRAAGGIASLAGNQTVLIALAVGLGLFMVLKRK